MIVAQGSEAGGHRSTFLGNAENALIGLMSLIPQLKRQIKIPIIAAGGIMNGKEMTAALCQKQSCSELIACLISAAELIYKK